MNEETLKSLRGEIDTIDKSIVELFERRMEIAHGIGKYKIENGKNVFDRSREEEKLRSLKALARNEFNQRCVEELFEQIMSMSKKYQYRLLCDMGRIKGSPFLPIDKESMFLPSVRVVYQGAEGAYSQLACDSFFGEKVRSFHVETFRDAMCALEDGSADFAVLPIENSTAGIVSEIYDLLAEFENYIVGEQIIKIEHCLLGVPGSSLESIRTVYSHPQSLMQSSRFLAEMGYEQISMLNNAFAAKKVSESKDKTIGALASEYAGRVYGLEVLKRAVNQSDLNSTRFIIVTNRKVYPRGAGTISLCFELPHKSGSLYHMLSHFIFNDLNLTRIESRPIEDRNWEYRFFVDFEGSIEDGAVKNALRGLREESRNMRVLGNY